MRVAVYDNSDELFGYLLVASARRRGHMAKQVGEIAEIAQLFDAEPAAILVGLGHLDDRAAADMVRLHDMYPTALIYVAAEESDAPSRLSALAHGVTDVLSKPVLPNELVLRAELARPRSGRDERLQGALRVGDIEVDLDEVRAVKANHELPLTRLELRLLYCLMHHHGGVAPTERLLTFGWESEEEFAASSLKTHMSHLRTKLQEAGGAPVRIKSRQMLGYALEIANHDPPG